MSSELEAKRARMKEIALERIWRGALTLDEKRELDKIDAALAQKATPGQAATPPAPVTGAVKK